jgi:hypothetical protein
MGWDRDRDRDKIGVFFFLDWIGFGDGELGWGALWELGSGMGRNGVSGFGFFFPILPFKSLIHLPCYSQFLGTFACNLDITLYRHDWGERNESDTDS